eukprot:CAMPEP_0196593786 /NCGR_PEP_ID=MMETSP1081-20130531/76565_1 /TAXON_ID=36882 /ORGANISM="Pyramimonas amylifera, Strain CCMP720" /LENGTH=118 /DNA_ID=CAMNT_0041917867 /DNA_START=437 /DNA_END=793 /DNA_ORIENTATION=-
MSYSSQPLREVEVCPVKVKECQVQLGEKRGPLLNGAEASLEFSHRQRQAAAVLSFETGKQGGRGRGRGGGALAYASTRLWGNSSNQSCPGHLQQEGWECLHGNQGDLLDPSWREPTAT